MVHRFLIIRRSVVFAVGELVAWARGNRRRIRVSGDSMEPVLRDADQILIEPVPDAPSRSLRAMPIGSVIVIDHPDPTRNLVLVKRLDSVLESGSLVVLSDNRRVGTDSRTFGPIEPAAVLGVATLHLNSLRQLSQIRGQTPNRR